MNKRRQIKNIILSDQDKSENLEIEIDKILSLLGFEGSIVTDESEISDFIDLFASQEEKEDIVYQLEEELGSHVDLNDYIVDVAERIKRKI